MSDPKKTLHEIIVEVLSQFSDSNLLSEEAMRRIADEVCNSYYNKLDISQLDEIKSE